MSPRSALRLALNALAAVGMLLGDAAPALAQNAAPIPYTAINPRPAVRPPVRQTPAPMATAIGPAPGVEPLSAPQLESFVDGVMASAMARGHVAGAAVVVVQNGQVVLKKGYGVDRLSPRRAVDPDRTLFRLGAISKTFTWIALQKEIESGRMRLDAPVNLYLPERLQIKDQGFRQPIRLRDLITHTSGFEDRALGVLVERDWRRERNLNTYLRQERPRRVREPGQTISYSNYGAALAGGALANVRGDTYERVIEQMLLIPAGLAHTTFREPRPERPDLVQPMNAAMAANVTQNLVWSQGRFVARPFEYLGHNAPAASASSTAADMGRYMTLLLAGGSVGGDTVWSPTVDRALRGDLYRPAPGAVAWTGGLQALPLPGGRSGFGHDGSTLFSNANLVIAPSLNLGVFVAANSGDAGRLTDDLPAQIVREAYGPAAAPPPGAASPPAVSNYVGAYLTTQRAYSGLEAFVGRLRGGATVEAGVNGALVTTFDTVRRAWFPSDAPNVYRAVDGNPQPLVFRLDANGRARALVTGAGTVTYERRGALDNPLLMAGLAGAALICALAVVVGLFFRLSANARQSLVQSRAGLSQTLQSMLWLIAMGCFGAWALAGSAGTERLLLEWPGGLIITASACALVAGILGAGNLVLLPLVWKGGRRVDSWSIGRKLRFTVTTLIFAALTVLIGLWGGLTPWAA